MDGKKIWYFPDGEIPSMGDDPEIYGHESLIILNPNNKDAHIKITLYWTNRAPETSNIIKVESERVRCLRANEKADFFGRESNAGEQYAIRLESDIPVVVQYGRLDITQPNMAFYTTNGYSI